MGMILFSIEYLRDVYEGLVYLQDRKVGKAVTDIWIKYENVFWSATRRVGRTHISIPVIQLKINTSYPHVYKILLQLNLSQICINFWFSRDREIKWQCRLFNFSICTRFLELKKKIIHCIAEYVNTCVKYCQNAINCWWSYCERSDHNCPHCEPTAGDKLGDKLWTAYQCYDYYNEKYEINVLIFGWRK